MRRARGVTLAEIVEMTGWQRHTVRGFVSILGNKAREDRKLEERRRGAQLPDREIISSTVPQTQLPVSARGAVVAFVLSKPQLSAARTATVLSVKHRIN